MLQYNTRIEIPTAVHPKLLSCRAVWTCPSVLLHQQYRLPVEFRIKFKLACFMYIVQRPQRMHTCLSSCSANSLYPSLLLVIIEYSSLAEPPCRLVLGCRALLTSAPKHWKELPLSLHESNSLQKWLKIHYFLLAVTDLNIFVHLHLLVDYPHLRFTFWCDPEACARYQFYWLIIAMIRVGILPWQRVFLQGQWKKPAKTLTKTYILWQWTTLNII